MQAERSRNLLQASIAQQTVTAGYEVRYFTFTVQLRVNLCIQVNRTRSLLYHTTIDEPHFSTYTVIFDYRRGTWWVAGVLV